MKKALLYGLAAVMLLSLTACGTAQANQPNEPDTTSPSAVQTEPPQETVVPSDKPDNVVGPLSANGNVKDATGTELYTIFEQGYQGGQIYVEFGLSEDELILMEIGEVESILGVRTDVKAPVDLESQYRAWRAEVHPATSTQAPIQSPAPAETQPSTGGQQQGNQNRTPQTSGGTGTYTPTQGDDDIPYFDFEAHEDHTPPKTDIEAGYKPSDWSSIVYGE